MSEALTYMYYTFDKFVDFVFNSMIIVPGVTFGWVVISIVLFSLLIRNILNLPRSMGSFDKFREHGYESVSKSFTDVNGYKHTRSYRKRLK